MSEGEIKKETEKKDVIKVLVVEDELLDLLKLSLEEVDNHEFVFAGSAEDALVILREAKAKGERISVFSDKRLPGKSGLELAKIAKEEQLTEYFTLYTGDQGYRDNSEGLKEMGINAIIIKPAKSIEALKSHFADARQAIIASRNLQAPQK